MKKSFSVLVSLLLLSSTSAFAQPSQMPDVVSGNCKALVVERTDNLISIKVAVSAEHLGVFQKTVSAPYRLECKNLQVTITSGDLQVKAKDVTDRFILPVVGAFSFSYLFDKDFSWKP